MRIVVLGGGFGCVAIVRHLEMVLRRRTNVEITLVSRENFFLLTPLLFEACSGGLELRHCAQPIRAAPLGDCAAIPGPDGRSYPALAQHAVREARHLAWNIRAVIVGRGPSPFIFRSLGTMASLGHTRAVARVFGVRLTGFVAWWVRRTYYLFQMPRWDRRLRIVLDWTVALFFRPDITRVDLRVEREQVKQARQLVERSSEIVRGTQT